VEASHELVSVGLALRQQTKQRDGEDPFQKLAVMDAVLGHVGNIALYPAMSST
jgi:hypothetical protein